MDWQAQTDSDGKFKVIRRQEPTYVHAMNADRSLAAIAELGDTKRTFGIHLQPVGSAKGRLVNDVKEAVSGQRIDYGVNVPDVEKETWSMRFGGHVVTDANGEFELQALAPGWEYRPVEKVRRAIEQLDTGFECQMPARATAREYRARGGASGQPLVVPHKSVRHHRSSPVGGERLRVSPCQLDWQETELR